MGASSGWSGEAGAFDRARCGLGTLAGGRSGVTPCLVFSTCPCHRSPPAVCAEVRCGHKVHSATPGTNADGVIYHDVAIQLARGHGYLTTGTADEVLDAGLPPASGRDLPRGGPSPSNRVVIAVPTRPGGVPYYIPAGQAAARRSLRAHRSRGWLGFTCRSFT